MYFLPSVCSLYNIFIFKNEIISRIWESLYLVQALFNFFKSVDIPAL